ncbi:asparagine synthase-related protein [Anoxynatronum sibiricum]|uniref:Asparagine synthase-related protein n=1 Tax=Anoxynatronum sibiricum TaxID=210623 RepID=A0ABU9VT30_9CLOT
MSAIAGQLKENQQEKTELPNLLGLMEHRGSHHQHYFYDGVAAMGLGTNASGNEKQPEEAYVSHDGKTTLIWDGELERTVASDMEKLVERFREKGIAFVAELKGAFALMMIDNRGKAPVLYAARDTLGAKPLYYAGEKGALVFSSEIKSLSSQAETAKPFPPGHYYTSDEGFIQYNEVVVSDDKILPDKRNQTNVIREVRRLTRRAVDRALDGDKNLGLMISGGLDSSLLAAIAKETGRMPAKSFCVGSSDSSDIPAARKVAEALGTDHYEYEYSLKEMVEALPKVIYYLESFEPSLVRSAVPNYFAFKMAAEHVEVVLSGEGADELFSGYTYLKDIKDPKALDRELIRVINGLHSIGLQRGDRMSAANGLEVRTPFLDKELMAYALRVPVQWKLLTQGNQVIEKWILRKAFDGETDLPSAILWRDKEEFSEGSGAKDCIEAYMEESITTDKYHQAVADIMKRDGMRIRSKEELYYYRIFREHYPHVAMARQVGRWADC